jgi:hypothetical protein
MLLLALTLAYGAYVSLCLAMPRHCGQVFGREPRAGRRAALMCAGWAGIALSLLACVHAAGWQFGPVYWVGLLVVAGVLLVFLLPYKPRIAAALGLAAPAACLVTILIN